MWQTKKGSEVGHSKKLEALFGVSAGVEPNKLYGSADSGTARTLFLPAVTHPMEHFSAAGVGHAVDWFQRMLTGAAAQRDPLDQIWIWKEIGTLAGFVGFVLLLLGVFQVLLTTPWFASLSTPATPAVEGRDGTWWILFCLTAILPAVTFYSFMKLGSKFAPSRVFPQGVMNQLVVWALLNAAITLVVGLLLGRRRAELSGRTAWGKSLLIAVCTIGVGYASLALVDRVFTVDYRFWVVGLKPLDARHFRIALIYLLPWTAFFLISLRALSAGLTIKGEGPATQYATAALALCLGFAVMLACQYSTLFLTGMLLTPSEPLNTVVAIQFVPLLAIIGVISAFTFRRTNSYAPGAFICAMFVTWYIAAGTAIHV